VSSTPTPHPVAAKSAGVDTQHPAPLATEHSAQLATEHSAQLAAAAQMKFRDPALARRLVQTISRVTSEIGRSPVSVMHVCGSHEQAIAKFGLRATFPRD